MNNKEFCHLHVHNQYSLLDGVESSEKYAKRAKKMGFEYLALTNHGNKGKKRSKEVKEKISLGMKGRIPWNKGKTNIYSKETLIKIANARLGKKHSPETKKKISLGGMGKKRSEKTKKRISEALKKYKYPKWRIKQAVKQLRICSLKRIGTQWPEEIKRKISFGNKGKHSHFEKRNPNWKGGISFLPYSPTFNFQLKMLIKNRDQNKCQNPGCLKKSDLLVCHHIDYDKQNSQLKNLITLCVQCNSFANSSRNYWESFYRRMAR